MVWDLPTNQNDIIQITSLIKWKPPTEQSLTSGESNSWWTKLSDIDELEVRRENILEEIKNNFWDCVKSRECLEWSKSLHDPNSKGGEGGREGDFSAGNIFHDEATKQIKNPPRSDHFECCSDVTELLLLTNLTVINIYVATLSLHLWKSVYSLYVCFGFHIFFLFVVEWSRGSHSWTLLG